MSNSTLNSSNRSRLVLSASIVLVLAVGLGIIQSEQNAPAGLTVYCAHDAQYSEQILREFERQTGIPVSIRFDTEATKSLGLVNLLLRERAHPRCDVFWNNELLGTMDLQRQELLVPYQGAGFRRMPDPFRDPAGHWVGFAARLRVYIINTERMPVTPEAVERKLAGDLSRVAIAKPLFGTTLTQYSALWQVWGPERLKAWHAETRRRGLLEAAGNAGTKNLVAQGTCDLAFTDTDDFFVAHDEHKPVAMLPVRLPGGETLCIPNSVAIIKGTRNLSAAQRLVDFLLSAETELALARSASRQIPLGPFDELDLPAEVRPLQEWAADAYDLRRLGPARAACLSWLRSEYLQ
jgi:iron(III) transport system substrate-binding protein